jgi:hypothetical protein
MNVVGSLPSCGTCIMLYVILFQRCKRDLSIVYLPATDCIAPLGATYAFYQNRSHLTALEGNLGKRWCYR